MIELQEVFIGRQPILTRDQQVYGYEMLFRSSRQNFANLPAEKCPTSVVLTNLFGDVGFNESVGKGKKAFINFSDGLLEAQHDLFFSSEDVVIEVLETVTFTPSIVKSIQRLKRQGFQIAFDDYVFSPSLEKFESLAHIVKVDLPSVDLSTLPTHVARLKSKGVRVLAEKVETLEEFERCKQMGFDLFQGYFFAKPQVIQQKALPLNHLSVLRLLNKTYDPSANLNDIVELVSQDVTLSQKVLTLSSVLSPNVSLNSVHDAVMRFGIRRMQGWIAMLLLSGLGNKPAELFTTALIRAKFCEQLGEYLGGPAKETFYTVGLLSVLDAVFDLEMNRILKEMNLDPLINQALLESKGIAGQVLQCVCHIEQGQLPVELELCKDSSGLKSIDLSHFYVKAMKYAAELTTT